MKKVKSFAALGLCALGALGFITCPALAEPLKIVGFETGSGI
jgi:hypothetical protein